MQHHFEKLACFAALLISCLLLSNCQSQPRQELTKTVIAENAIQVIWVGDTVSTNLVYDLKVPGGNQIDLSAARIKEMLQERGIIFKA
jgi:bifunctional enzyme CysN/CysC